MKMFIVSFVVCSMIFGVFGLLFGWSKSGKFFSLETLLGLIPSTVLALIVAVVMSLQFTNDNTEWNDGKCPKCSIEWELFDIEKHRHSTTYFYQCPECKTVIDTAMDMTN